MWRGSGLSFQAWVGEVLGKGGSKISTGTTRASARRPTIVLEAAAGAGQGIHRSSGCAGSTTRAEAPSRVFRRSASAMSSASSLGTLMLVVRISSHTLVVVLLFAVFCMPGSFFVALAAFDWALDSPFVAVCRTPRSCLRRCCCFHEPLQRLAGFVW